MFIRAEGNTADAVIEWNWESRVDGDCVRYVMRLLIYKGTGVMGRTLQITSVSGLPRIVNLIGKRTV